MYGAVYNILYCMSNSLVEGEPYLVCGSVRALDMPLKILV